MQAYDSNDESSDNENESSSHNKVKKDLYAIVVKKTNKDDLKQPNCSLKEILPNLPTGILVVGKSGSGKTQAIVNLMTNNKLLKNTFDFVYFWTGIHPDKELIKDLELSDQNIKIDFNENDVSKIMNKMEQSVKKVGFIKTPSVLFIFDDILGNTDFLKSKTLVKLASANRHMNISYIISSQYYKKIPPVVRTNASYFMIFPSSDIELQKIADELTPPSMNKKQFLDIAKHATKDKYSFLSINSKCTAANQLRKGFNTVLNFK